MTTQQLHRAVSRATGEDVDLIARRGFSLVEDKAPLADDNWAAMALDWDQLDVDRADDGRSAA